MNEIAIKALLAFAALHAGFAGAEPAVRQATSSVLAQTPVPALKREYLRCDRASSQTRLSQEVALHCSAVSDELLKREFDGDLDLLLAWWRTARNAPE